VGCDLKYQKYGVRPSDLAAAICQSVRYSMNQPAHLLTHHLTKNAISKRVNILLKPGSTRFRKMRSAFSFLAMGIAFLVIFLGRFWIF
jgi:hypothetical protein